jgi:hypothetical protein
VLLAKTLDWQLTKFGAILWRHRKSLSGTDSELSSMLSTQNQQDICKQATALWETFVQSQHHSLSTVVPTPAPKVAQTALSLAKELIDPASATRQRNGVALRFLSFCVSRWNNNLPAKADGMIDVGLVRVDQPWVDVGALTNSLGSGVRVETPGSVSPDRTQNAKSVWCSYLTALHQRRTAICFVEAKQLSVDPLQAHRRSGRLLLHDAGHVVLHAATLSTLLKNNGPAANATEEAQAWLFSGAIWESAKSVLAYHDRDSSARYFGPSWSRD